MATVTDFEILQAMIQYGGSFVAALARAAQFADVENMARLKTAWPEYWQTYKDLAILKAQGEREKGVRA